MRDQSKQRLLELLQEADALLSEARPSPEADARIRASLHRSAGRRWMPGLPALAIAAAAAALLLSLQPSEQPRERPVRRAATAPAPPAPPAAPEVVAGFTTHHCQMRDEGGVLSVSARCTVMPADGPPARVEVWPGARLRRTTEGMRIDAGRVRFQVQTVRGGQAPFRVAVSGGVIEVVGTVFEIEQRPDGGSVRLEEGRIRFLPTSGDARLLLPGESHTWGAGWALAAGEAERPAGEPEPAVAAEHAGERDEAPRPRARRARRLSGPGALSQILKLRRQGRAREAAIAAQAALRQPLGDRKLEAISWEAATIWEALNDGSQACEQLLAHRRRFPKGSRIRQVARAIDRLGCAP